MSFSIPDWEVTGGGKQMSRKGNRKGEEETERGQDQMIRERVGDVFSLQGGVREQGSVI